MRHHHPHNMHLMRSMKIETTWTTELLQMVAGMNSYMFLLCTRKQVVRGPRNNISDMRPGTQITKYMDPYSLFVAAKIGKKKAIDSYKKMRWSLHAVKYNSGASYSQSSCHLGSHNQ